MTEKTCIENGCELPTVHPKSPRCDGHRAAQRLANALAHKRRNIPKLRGPICIEEGCELPTTSSRASRCAEHRIAAERAMKVASRARNPRQNNPSYRASLAGPSGMSCASCQKPLRSDNVTGYCEDHLHQSADRAALRKGWNIAWREDNRDYFRNVDQDRRARKRDQFVEHVDRAVVWDRDGGVCHICRLPADPADWHLDHVIPLIKDGPHSYANTAVSHPRCNISKGAKII